MKINRKTVLVSTLCLAAAGGVSAFAWVSSTFDAAGKGSTSSPQNLTGTVTGVPNDFGPGDSATLRVTASNPNHFPVHIQNATFTVDPITDCPSDSFAISTPTYPNPDVPGATSSGNGTRVDAAQATITFVNTGANQNACLNHEITVRAHVS